MERASCGSMKVWLESILIISYGLWKRNDVKGLGFSK